MGGMVKIVGNAGGQKNASPEIRNLRTDGTITPTSFTIKYIAEDFENTILRHYLILNNVKSEITKTVGYERPNNEFTYELNNLTHNTLYSIKIEVTDGINIIQSNLLEVRTESAVIYGIKILENNSNPKTCVTYINDAVDIGVAQQYSLGGWANKFPFNQIKLVGLKNGQETKEVNPNNKLNYYGGIPVPADVDVMVRIPKVYWKVNTIANGYEIRISNVKVDSTYDCYAHKVNNIEKDNIYVGAYLGYVENNKLRSKSGVSATMKKSLSDFRSYAQNNGNGYQQMTWFTLTLLRILFVLAYKNLNCQDALGFGVSLSTSANTGGTNVQGMIYGNKADGSHQVCFCGVEDFYGNYHQWVDGIYIDSDGGVNVLLDNSTFNNEYSGYTKTQATTSNNLSQQIMHVTKDSKGLFVPSLTGASDSTHYCDYTLIRTGYCGTFGGSSMDDKRVGIFNMIFNYYPETSPTNTTSRLCYL